MARSSAPPGPPPPHYRPPGATRGAGPTGSGPLLGRPLAGSGTLPVSPQERGAGPGAVTVIALVTLLIGIVVGFFVGRATESDDATAAAPPLTSPLTTPTSRPPGNTVPQSPAPDPSAPPSTDLDPTTIGSIDDPIPAGQAYVLGLYELEVRSAVLDAADALAAFDASNPPAREGRQHVLVEIAVRFTDGSGLGNPASIPFFLGDGTGQWNDFEATCGSVPNSLLRSGLIEQDEEAVGNTCFTVPVDVIDDVLLGTESFSGPVYFALPR